MQLLNLESISDHAIVNSRSSLTVPIDAHGNPCARYWPLLESLLSSGLNQPLDTHVPTAKGLHPPACRTGP
jgi:hypothetical protein